MNETNTEQQSPKANCMCGGAGPNLTRLAEMLLPSGEAGAHFRQAHLELLKGLRAMLDQRIESMSQPRQGTKLSVD